ncbi:MAG: DsbA family oxidoreductase [Betaproteobacteria bacterium]|nr:DsbA family oxidoreductase [Betaproteobacteria bacterium]
MYRERFPDAAEPAVRWLPFQLNPDVAETGMSRAEYVMRKFGERGGANYARVAAVGATVGIPFAFDKIQVQPNTTNAHRLMHYGGQRGAQDEVAEELFRAYFVEGANLTDRDTLADIGARAGLEREAALGYLASETDCDLIRSADIEARNAGIGGVPFFIFNRKVGVSGAQEAETLLDALLQAIED